MENNTMTISVVSPSRTEDSEFGTLNMSITVTQDINLDALMDIFERLAVGLTYSPNSWRDVILAKAETYARELNRGKHNA